MADLHPDIQFYRARIGVDPKFLALVAELEVAYYGHWRHGVSHPWRGHDIEPKTTAVEAKALFDRLHGAIWTAHTIAVAEANDALPENDRYPAEKIDPERDDDRGEKTTAVGLAQAKLEADPEALALIKSWAADEGLVVDTKTPRARAQQESPVRLR